jgi:hypothetical protein
MKYHRPFPNKTIALRLFLLRRGSLALVGRVESVKILRRVL